jgi:hypothetical protein
MQRTIIHEDDDVFVCNDNVYVVDWRGNEICKECACFREEHVNFERIRNSVLEEINSDKYSYYYFIMFKRLNTSSFILCDEFLQKVFESKAIDPKFLNRTRELVHRKYMNMNVKDIEQPLCVKEIYLQRVIKGIIK